MPRFQWNDEKNRTNKAKHGVSFETACLIWNDPQYLLIPDAVYDGEQRWLAIGVVGLVTVLVAVHIILAEDEETVRVISARKATSHERRRYEQSTLN
ncbi:MULTISPECIES: BrnT family toxin [Rhizobium]|uniref:BrnT family toxin n=1 Tax=Rhizobium TaxID=379 RepID=UPI00144235E5|nr:MULTISPECIES: BrnT family toxin [Rhizobium]MBY3197879.1 BrnT family toxin [Rhizobium laguerreae]MBY3226583.1 BrnT family toxin [Rhizobium laguerreae]MBY3556612.1 BrnT family toxin [Rhizobium laguerreae]MBY5841354.1 BrnT family toxin [Rhizobium leguminosarum]NKM81861.1 BrnT family toxin [Rhizobium leguminosarum bv. viciae]